MFQNRAEALALALPAAIFAAAGFLVPVFMLLSEGFHTTDGWTLSAYADFFSDPLNRAVFLRTLKLGALVTIVSAVVGYAAAFAIVNLSQGAKGHVVNLVVLPLMISPVARTYAWIVILGRTGNVNQALQAVGLSDAPIRILFSETAVFIGLLQLFLPLMIISLISARASHRNPESPSTSATVAPPAAIANPLNGMFHKSFRHRSVTRFSTTRVSIPPSENAVAIARTRSPGGRRNSPSDIVP